MIETKPSVRLIAQTAVDKQAMSEYLNEVGASDYTDKVLDEPLDGAGVLTMFAGKLCYNAFVPGINPNVTKVRDDGMEYCANILKQAHLSVTEHVTGTFICNNVSRVFTHELVRHRVGIAYAQESLRYCRLTDLKFWMPSVFEDLLPGEDVERMKKVIYQALEGMEGDQKQMANIANVEGLTFADKKLLTSAFRRIAPMGLSTKIIFTANIRTLRHLILMRTSLGAEEEIRIVFDNVAKICIETWPSLFQDFYKTDYSVAPPVWGCSNSQQPYGA